MEFINTLLAPNSKKGFKFDITDKIDTDSTDESQKIQKIVEYFKLSPSSFIDHKHGVDNLNEQFIDWVRLTFKLDDKINRSKYFKDVMKTFEEETKTINKEPIFIIRLDLNQKKTRQMIFYKKGNQPVKGFIYELPKFKDDSEALQKYSDDYSNLIDALILQIQYFTIPLPGASPTYYSGADFILEFYTVVENYLTCKEEIVSPLGTTIKPKEVYEAFKNKIKNDIDIRTVSTLSPVDKEQALWYFVLQTPLGPTILNTMKSLYSTVDKIHNLICVQLQEGGGEKKRRRKISGGGPNELRKALDIKMAQVKASINTAVTTQSRLTSSVSAYTPQPLDQTAVQTIITKVTSKIGQVQDPQIRSDIRQSLLQLEPIVNPPTGSASPSAISIPVASTLTFVPIVSLDVSVITCTSSSPNPYLSYLPTTRRVEKLVKNASAGTGKELENTVCCDIQALIPVLNTKIESLDAKYVTINQNGINNKNIKTELKGMKDKMENYLTLIGDATQMNVILKELVEKYTELHGYYIILSNHYINNKPIPATASLPSSTLSNDGKVCQGLPIFNEILQISYNVLLIYKNTLCDYTSTYPICSNDLFKDENYQGPSLMPLSENCSNFTNQNIGQPLTSSTLSLISGSGTLDKDLACSIKTLMENLNSSITGIDAIEISNSEPKTADLLLYSLKTICQDFLHHIGNPKRMKELLEQMLDIFTKFNTYYQNFYVLSALSMDEMLLHLRLYKVVQTYSNIFTIFKNTIGSSFTDTSPIPGPTVLTETFTAIGSGSSGTNPIIGYLDTANMSSLVKANKTQEDTIVSGTYAYLTLTLDTTNYNFELVNSFNIKKKLEQLRWLSLFTLLMVRTGTQTGQPTMESTIENINTILGEFKTNMTYNNIKSISSLTHQTQRYIIQINGILQVFSNISMIYQKTNQVMNPTGGGTAPPFVITYPAVGLINTVGSLSSTASATPNPVLQVLPGSVIPSLFNATPAVVANWISDVLSARRTLINAAIAIDKIPNAVKKRELLEFYCSLFFQSIGKDGDGTTLNSDSSYQTVMGQWITAIYDILKELTVQLAPANVATFNTQQLDQTFNLLQVVQGYGNICQIFDATNLALNPTSYSSPITDFGDNVLLPSLVTRTSLTVPTACAPVPPGVAGAGSREINAINPYETPDYNVTVAVQRAGEANAMATEAQVRANASGDPLVEEALQITAGHLGLINLANADGYVSAGFAVSVVANVVEEDDNFTKSVALATFANAIAAAATGVANIAEPPYPPIIQDVQITNKIDAVNAVTIALIRATGAIYTHIRNDTAGGTKQNKKDRADAVITAIQIANLAGANTTATNAGVPERDVMLLHNAFHRVLTCVKNAVEGAPEDGQIAAFGTPYDNIARNATASIITGATEYANSWFNNYAGLFGAEAVQIVVAQDTDENANARKEFVEGLQNIANAWATTGLAPAPAVPAVGPVPTKQQSVEATATAIIAVLGSVLVGYNSAGANFAGQLQRIEEVRDAIFGQIAGAGGNTGICTKVYQALLCIVNVGTLSLYVAGMNAGGAPLENTNIAPNAIQLIYADEVLPATILGAGKSVDIYTPLINGASTAYTTGLGASPPGNDGACRTAVDKYITDKLDPKEAISIPQVIQAVFDAMVEVESTQRRTTYTALRASIAPAVKSVESLLDIMKCFYALLQIPGLDNGVSIDANAKGAIETAINDAEGMIERLRKPGAILIDVLNAPIIAIFNVANAFPGEFKALNTGNVGGLNDTITHYLDIVITFNTTANNLADPAQYAVIQNAIKAMFIVYVQQVLPDKIRNGALTTGVVAGVNFTITNPNVFTEAVQQICNLINVQILAIQTKYDNMIDTVNPLLKPIDVANIPQLYNATAVQDEVVCNVFYMLNYINQSAGIDFAGFGEINGKNVELVFKQLKQFCEYFLQIVQTTEKNKQFMNGIITQINTILSDKIHKTGDGILTLRFVNTTGGGTLTSVQITDNAKCVILYQIDLASRYYQNILLVFARAFNELGGSPSLTISSTLTQPGPYLIRNFTSNPLNAATAAVFIAIPGIGNSVNDSLYTNNNGTINDQIYINLQKTLFDNNQYFNQAFMDNIRDYFGDISKSTSTFYGYNSTNQRIGPIYLINEFTKLHDLSLYFMKLILNPNVINKIRLVYLDEDKELTSIEKIRYNIYRNYLMIYNNFYYGENFVFDTYKNILRDVSPQQSNQLIEKFNLFRQVINQIFKNTLCLINPYIKICN